MPVHVRRFTDAAEFLKLTTPMLMRDEAPNCFFLGNVANLPDIVVLCAVCDGDKPVAAAVMTPGHPLLLTAAPREAIETLVEFLHANEIALPGVQSRRGDAEFFAQSWCSRSDVAVERSQGMGIYKLARVCLPRAAAGTFRAAEESDVDLVAEWMQQFGRDIGEHFARPRENAVERIAERRIFLWTNPQPVSMAAWAGPTPNGVRINLVYTPPEFRHRGYASACVASLSQRMLDGGKKFCFLYTDLSNPTSNKIYRDIGYEHVRDDTRIFFREARVSDLKPILPGAAVGVLGSGQLGRMFAIAARRMGYRVHTLSPDSDTPTGQVADVEINAAYDDLDAIRNFAKSVSAVTFEFENVPAAAAEAAAQIVPVRPNGSVLHTTQNRLREKTFLAQHGFPVTPFRAVHNEVELRQAIQQLGCPGVLKTAGFGYDGKGQTEIRRIEDAPPISGEFVYEKFIDFDREVSVIAARGVDGAFAHWGMVHNEHRRHILDLSIAPADVPAKVERAAIEITRGVVEALDLAGVLCVEFFLTKAGDLMINELAPRPHNSGHFTFDASVTSQFEQQLRAVCGLPLGSTKLLRPAAMANLLGDLWRNGEPNWPAACAFADVKLHLYGKQAPRPGRKMGHLTALADTPADAAKLALAARDALTRR